MKNKDNKLKIIIQSDARKALSDLGKIDARLKSIEERLKSINSVSIKIVGKISGDELVLASNRAIERQG